MTRRFTVLAAAALLLAPDAPHAQAPVPLGAEFSVGLLDNGVEPVSVGMDANGGFVVAWRGDEIQARRYAADGTPKPAFRANTITNDIQGLPSVALDDDGDFLVAWSSFEQGGGGNRIHAQRFSSAGTLVGAEVGVSTVFRFADRTPRVALDADGDAVIVWDSGSDPTRADVYARLYTAAGDPKGPDFLVNTVTVRGQYEPAVAMDATGNFLVAWTGLQGGPLPPAPLVANAYAARFGAAGAPRASEFRVNTGAVDSQGQPAVGMDAAGNAVVVWSSLGQDGSGTGIYARRYLASGVSLGGEFRVNTTTAGDQTNPEVAMAADGTFAVAWVGPDPAGSGIYAQAYGASGAPLGGEFRVNTTTAGEQVSPAVAVSDDGDLVVVWASNQASPAVTNDLFGQRFALAPVAGEAAPETPAALAVSIAPVPAGASGAAVRYTLAAAGEARVTVVDALGREVAVLADGTASAGVHEARFSTAGLAPGVYAVRVEAGGAVAVARVPVVR